MKAVVLVGGEGTRLRPLTETTPKPLLPLVDRPMLDHVLDHLARHGVHEVVLSSPYLERTFHPFIDARHGDPVITWITESEPLGTGGAIVNALEQVGDEPFFALNGDIVTDLDLSAMRTAHIERGAAISIALHAVEDARAFGLVETSPQGWVTAFREKPEEPMPGEVNAGTYLLDPTELRAWTPDRAISIEREIFPAVIRSGGPVVGYVSDAYWLDLGTPEKYLQAHADMLAGRVEGVEYQAPWLAPDADVDAGASLGRWVVVGPEARVAVGARVTDSVLHAGSVIGVGAEIGRSVVGAGARVGAGAVLTDCVLGAGSRVPDGSTASGMRLGVDSDAPSG